MQLLKSLWNGELALWKSFWVFGVVVLLALTYVCDTIISKLILGNPGAVGFFIAIYVITVFGYTVVAYVGIWRSADRYPGFKLWPYAAKSWILLNVAILLVTAYFVATTDTDDPGKNSGNIAEQLAPDQDYPFIGFWKSHCTDAFGLSIDKVEKGLYSVSFCGPGGCFKPGSYRPNTRLLDDESYRVIDQDTLEVEGADGFSTYYRCQ